MTSHQARVPTTLFFDVEVLPVRKLCSLLQDCQPLRHDIDSSRKHARNADCGPYLNCTSLSSTGRHLAAIHRSGAPATGIKQTQASACLLPTPGACSSSQSPLAVPSLKHPYVLDVFLVAMAKYWIKAAQGRKGLLLFACLLAFWITY